MYGSMPGIVNKENSQMARMGPPTGKPFTATPGSRTQVQVDTEILVEKEQTIHQLRDTIEILELKIKKLEQLVKVKDTKIGNLTNKL